MRGIDLKSFNRALVMLTAFVLSTPAGLADDGVMLKRMPPLGPGIPALPRLVAKPGDRAAALIDHALAAEDADAKSSAADCKQMGKQHSDFTRSVTVAMRGAGYLSIVATRSWYCGGAYPDWNTTPFVYDLATGAPVDWNRLLPASLLDQPIDYNTPGERLVASAALTKLYIRLATNDAECRDVLTNWTGGLGFILWPDAAADGIAIEANNLPHVAKACGPDVTIAMPDLRKLGIDAALLDAIDQAHRRAWYDKPAGKR